MWTAFFSRITIFKRLRSITVSDDDARNGNMVEPPGSLLLKMGVFVLPPKMYRSTIEQTVAGERIEYFKALDAGEVKRAKWIRMRLWITVSSNLTSWFVGAIIDPIVRALSGAGDDDDS